MLEKLKGQRVELVKIDIKDAESIFQAVKKSYHEISPWASWLHINYGLDDAQKFVELQIKNWQNNEEFSYAVKDSKGNLLGVISLHVFDGENGVANIGYWMSSDYTCRGYCTEAVTLLVSNAMVQLNLIRIELIAGVNNIASQKVAEKSGAQFEAILKKRIRPNGISADARLYAFTKS